MKFGKRKQEFHEAVRSGGAQGCRAVLRECWSEQQMDQLINSTDSSGWTALHRAAADDNISIIAWLLKGRGRDVGFRGFWAKTRSQQTALHLAVERGFSRAYRLLMSECRNEMKKALLHMTDANNETVWEVAMKTGQDDVIMSVVHDLSSINFYGFAYKKPFLHLAATFSNLDMLKYILSFGKWTPLLNALDREGRTVLHCAARSGNVSIIQWLLSEGRHFGFNGVTVKSNLGQMTALHEVLEETLLSGCCSNLIIIKTILIGCTLDEKRVLLNALDANGCTLLHLAAKKNDGGVISFLVSKDGRDCGFDSLLAKTGEGTTALHIAAKQDNLEGCKAILGGCQDDEERQQLVSVVDKAGWMAHHYAASNKSSSIITFFLHDEIYKEFKLTRTSQQQQTVLHIAVQGDRFDVCNAILENFQDGAEKRSLLMAQDIKGWTPLHYAARLGTPAVIRHFFHHPEIKLAMNMKDKLGLTALHRAILGFPTGGTPSTPFHTKADVVGALLFMGGEGGEMIDPNIGKGLESLW